MWYKHLIFAVFDAPMHYAYARFRRKTSMTFSVYETNSNEPRNAAVNIQLESSALRVDFLSYGNTVPVICEIASWADVRLSSCKFLTLIFAFLANYLVAIILYEAIIAFYTIWTLPPSLMKIRDMAAILQDSLRWFCHDIIPNIINVFYIKVLTLSQIEVIWSLSAAQTCLDRLWL